MRIRERVAHAGIGEPDPLGGGDDGGGCSARGRLAGATLVTMVPGLRRIGDVHVNFVRDEGYQESVMRDRAKGLGVLSRFPRGRANSSGGIEL
jgi:hypothetical protein